MSNFTEALTSGARSAACQLLGIPQYLNDMTTRLSGGLFTPPLSQIPNLWRRALCDTDAPDPQPPPFLGGQCVAPYTVQITWTGQGALINGSCTNRAGSTSGSVLGPISFGGVAREDLGGENFRLRATFRDRNGGLVILSTSVFSDSCGGGSIGSITAVRNDGQPDNCGNPEPDYEEPTPEQVEIPIDITYNNNLNIPVVIPVLFVFARAYIDARANLIIPFTLVLSPELSVTGSINVDGSVQFNFGGGTTSTQPKDPRKSPCDDISLPDGEVPEDPTDSDQPDEPERDEERVIKGALVTVTQIQDIRSSVITQDENPDIYAPSLGHINFLCRVGTIAGGWSVDLPVKNRRNLIQCPWDEGAVEVRGTPQPGVTWEITPVYGLRGAPVEYIQ